MLEVSEAKGLRSLELENARLKRPSVDAMQDVSTVKEMPEKFVRPGPGERRGRLGDEGKGVLAAAGLRSGGDGSAGLTAAADPAGGRGDTAALREMTAECRRFGIGACTVCFRGKVRC